MLKGWIILDEWSMNSHHLLRVLPLESIVQVIASQNLFIQRNFKKKIWVSGNIFNICFLMSPNHNFTFFFFLFFGVRRGGGGGEGRKGAGLFWTLNFTMHKFHVSEWKHIKWGLFMRIKINRPVMQKIILHIRFTIIQNKILKKNSESIHNIQSNIVIIG